MTDTNNAEAEKPDTEEYVICDAVLKEDND